MKLLVHFVLQNLIILFSLFTLFTLHGIVKRDRCQNTERAKGLSRQSRPQGRDYPDPEPYAVHVFH